MSKKLSDEDLRLAALKLRCKLKPIRAIAKILHVSTKRVDEAIAKDDPAFAIMEQYAAQRMSLIEIAERHGVTTEALVPIAKGCSREAQAAFERRHAKRERYSTAREDAHIPTNWAEFFSDPANRTRTSKDIAAELGITMIAVCQAARRHAVVLRTQRDEVWARRRAKAAGEEEQRRKRREETLARWNAQAASMGYSMQAGR